jgi:hypothetical protein
MLFHFRESPCFSLFYSLKNIGNDSTFQGLFKNAQMQGAQEASRIWTYVERCGLQRNEAGERFSTASFTFYSPPSVQ